MTRESNAKGNPWEYTPLPAPEIIFRCPGKGWHDYNDARPYDLVWVQGIDGSDCPGDGFYCDQCVFDAKKKAVEKGETLVTGPTLEEELKRCGMWHLVDDEWLNSFDLTRQYHSELHDSDNRRHLFSECPYGKNVTGK